MLCELHKLRLPLVGTDRVFCVSLGFCVSTLSMIIKEVDVGKTLFLDVTGNSPRPELEPRLWRTTINTEPLFGRFFGFHYAPDMRNFLTVVNVARGSISSAAASTADTRMPMIRNIATLGWGWVYSHMVILNNLGMRIDGASQIGVDDTRIPHGIEEVRTFMNLAEDPVFSGVVALASADVAVDILFSIGGEAHERSKRSSVDDALAPSPAEPIPVRIVSYPGRPITRSDLVHVTSKRTRPPASERDLQVSSVDDVDSPRDHVPVVDSVERSDAVPVAQDVGVAGSKWPLESISGVVKQVQEQIGAATSRYLESPVAETDASPETPVARSEEVPPVRSDSIAGKVGEKSVLASAIKKEFDKLQSNVSAFLAPHYSEPASALIIHFHGGGFISQSSAGHLVYLKEWAADVPDAVILSVDYRWAPENPYPAALDDCLYAYQWALENAAAIGTRAERIVLTGDSAGGNLAVAVALKAQARGLRAADGIGLAYPALYVNVAWSPSRLLSFFDPLLPLSILDICLRAYVPEGERPHDNPFISPLVASPEALKALPPIAVIVGSLDPLLDDAVQFARNLQQQGRETDTLRVIESLPHGFLNMVQVSRQAREASGLLSGQLAAMLQVPQRPGRGPPAPAGTAEEASGADPGINSIEEVDSFPSSAVLFDA